jgi:hypothetical protein
VSALARLTSAAPRPRTGQKFFWFFFYKKRTA